MAETKDIRKQEAAAGESAERTRAKAVYTPAVDIIEKKDAIILTTDMPGVDEGSVDITLDNNQLTLYGKVDPDVPSGFRLAMREYGIGDYERVFTITDEIDRDRIEASVKNGVVRLLLPKADKVTTRKIAVKSS